VVVFRRAIGGGARRLPHQQLHILTHREVIPAVVNMLPRLLEGALRAGERRGAIRS
jgi:hypothetical protein